jgi:hypothetical protein
MRAGVARTHVTAPAARTGINFRLNTAYLGCIQLGNRRSVQHSVERSGMLETIWWHRNIQSVIRL